MNLSTQLKSLPDDILLEKSLSRDREAYAALVSRYQALVCSLAYSICGDIGQSEDLAQEAFITAWKKLGSLREKSQFKSWLCGITRNLSLKAVRKRQSEESLKDSLMHRGTVGEGTEENFVSREEQQILWRAIEKMPENYREPLILYYREEQSVSQVANSLDISQDAVKQRLSRGRGLLRDTILTLMEDVLIRTKPGPVFTAAVIGSLPGLIATSAAAATAGTAGKAAVGAGAVSSGALFGTLGGVGGAFLGYLFGRETARFETQQKSLRKGFVGSLVIVFVFMLPWITMGLGWWSVTSLGRPLYLVLWFSWFASFFAALAGWSYWTGKKSRDAAIENRKAGVPELDPGPVRRWLQGWEGRRWNSRATCFGLPLVSIAFNDPDRDFSGAPDQESGDHKIAKGWIAIGDRAIGVLALGNLAVGGIAVGSISVGFLSVGGVAAGGIALGGLSIAALSFAGFAVGIGAIGGLAVGGWSFGGASFGWKAASGGFAVARDMAVGGEAVARHANDEIARTYVESSAFFDWGRGYLEILQQPGMIPLLFFATFAMVALMLTIGFRRRPESKDP